DDGLALAAYVTIHPGGIDVGRVDRVVAGFEEGIEQVERCLLVRRPAEHIAAEYDGSDGKAGPAERAHLHEGLHFRIGPVGPEGWAQANKARHDEPLNLFDRHFTRGSVDACPVAARRECVVLPPDATQMPGGRKAG